MNEQTERQLLSPAEFASRSGLSMATVRRYLAAGYLPKVQPGGHGARVLIPAGALSVITNDHNFDCDAPANGESRWMGRRNQ